MGKRVREGEEEEEEEIHMPPKSFWNRMYVENR